MRVGFVVTAIVILGGAASAGAQSNDPAPIARPVVNPPVSVSVPPPPPLPSPPPIAPSGKSRGPIPTGNPGTWVTTNDYPTRALREGREGVTGFRITVGPDGRPLGCEITSSSGSPDLDSVTCELIASRAMFKPALDLKGRPTQGTYVSRVRWVIPNTPTSIAPESRTMTFVVEPDGTVTNCVETRDGVPVENPTTNSPCMSSAGVNPFKDAAGNPVRKQVTVRFSITVTDPPK